MESERLKALKRQKALLLEHIAWLDQEIDQEASTDISGQGPAPHRLGEALLGSETVAYSLSDVSTEIESSPPEQVASTLYSELGPDTKGATEETKRGCLIFGSLAFLFLAALGSYVAFYY